MANKQAVNDMADNRRKPENDSLTLLIYRMDELKALFVENTTKQENRVAQIELRLGNLESWRAGREAVEAQAKADKSKGDSESLLNDKLIRVILAVLAILAGVLGLNIGGVLK